MCVLYVSDWFAADAARAVVGGHSARGGRGHGRDRTAVRARIRRSEPHHFRIRATQRQTAQGGDRV
jgi:hypothetical protein